MKLSVIKLDGKAAGDVELSDAVFGISDTVSYTHLTLPTIYSV